MLVGVGRCHDSAEPVELMARAAQAALTDSGSSELGRRIGRIAIPRGTWTIEHPGSVIAARLGCPGAHQIVAEVGVPQQTLVSDALRGVLTGETDVALVVGGEARAWAAGRRRESEDVAETATTAAPDVVLRPARSIVSHAEIAARCWDPVQQYALIESALLHAEGGRLDEIDALWARFSQVAAGNPFAAFPTARTPAELRSPEGGNRLLAEPYRKWHSTQWTVDQAAALLVCSAGAARAAGVPADRWVFPRVALESSWFAPLPARRDLHRWPAMRVLGEAAEAWLDRRLADLDVIEVYSCFPSAVRVQQRELGLPIDATPTVTGGMPFAGGPFNNFTYQATVTVAERLRATPGASGLVTTVSGLLTKPGLMVWSSEPGPLLLDDLTDAAEAATAVCPVEVGAQGEATIVASTVLADGESIAIAERPDGARVVARSGPERADGEDLGRIGRRAWIQDVTFL